MPKIFKILVLISKVKTKVPGPKKSQIFQFWANFFFNLIFTKFQTAIVEPFLASNDHVIAHLNRFFPNFWNLKWISKICGFLERQLKNVKISKSVKTQSCPFWASLNLVFWPFFCIFHTLGSRSNFTNFCNQYQMTHFEPFWASKVAPSMNRFLN